MNSHLLPLFISYRSSGEKLIKYQANSSCVIMSVILITTLFYKALILQGEIWCWSPLGLKGLKSWKINNSDLTQQKLFKLSIFTNFYRLTAAGVNNSLQVLQGALVVGWEKKRELATTSLEFQYLHQKNWSKLLIGEYDISYIVNTLGSCFHMFFIVCLHSHSFKLRTD